MKSVFRRLGPRQDWVYEYDDRGELHDTGRKHLVFIVEAWGSDDRWHATSCSAHPDMDSAFWDSFFEAMEFSLKDRMVREQTWKD